VEYTNLESVDYINLGRAYYMNW